MRRAFTSPRQRPARFFSACSSVRRSRTLRLVPHADLANFDPVWTTAFITRNAGVLAWDTTRVFSSLPSSLRCGDLMSLRQLPGDREQQLLLASSARLGTLARTLW